MSDLTTAKSIASAVRTRKALAAEVITASLERIRRTNEELNAFCDVYEEDALAAARRIDSRIANGEDVGSLAGVPVAVKDFTPLKGKRTTYGSLVYKDNIGEFDPIYVQRLRAAGAIVIGKTNTPEFAYSGFCHNKVFGTTVNPWDTTRTSGGSSGGAAAVVASNMVPLAEGTDMGGSIRGPASYCGCVGLKPSLGRIPMDILKSVHDTISHFGPLARTVEDAWLFLDATKGPNECDPMSLPDQAIPFDIDGGVKGLRIALSVDLGHFAVDDAVAKAMQTTADALRAAGAIVNPIDMPWDASIAEAFRTSWRVYLAAFEGDLLKKKRDLLDPDLADCLEEGFKIDGPTYKRVEILRRKIWLDLVSVFESHDALLCPTTAGTAPLASLRDKDFKSVRADGKLQAKGMTHPFNFTPHCPALSIPCGVGPGPLPIGAQIVGRRFDEATVLKIGRAVEKCGLMGDLRPRIFAE
ncbi:amidase [Mesorhizobium sp. 113-1-2]|uniref:amidase n=1 Tax=Mesorhizobium sp. 113-1-2 TaxID=2744515 RepID=UPI0019260825|nr:amidase [Mesorhizobium sp. 113-1-2]BCG76161.1 amidase [Mesorhizobium sp. 113-1-2]